MKKSEKNLKINKINNNAKSFLAKLLATENISVEHKKVKTAYFDVKSRLLVLPIWKDMNEDITDLLIAHEVGHALFTPQAGWEDAIKERNIPKSFLNVIEDARIEKLIKRRYPGLSQSFIKGYRDLINNDFFGTRDKDLNDMLLIDRLNIHFKSSHVESPLTFTDSYENDVVSRMEKLETFEDVIELADELSKYCKEEQEEKEEDMQTSGFDDHDFDDIDDSDWDYDSDNSDSSDKEDEEKEEEEKSGSKPADSDSSDDEDEDDGQQKSDEPSAGIQSERELKGAPSKPVAPPEEVSAETDQSWEDKKENLLDPASKNNEYVNIHNYKNVNDYIIDYKTVLKDFDRILKKPYQAETKDAYAQRSISKMISKYRLFNKAQSKKVSYMVKEYEMKKAASAYSRTKQDKSGIIYPLKLHSYKYNDDIFKRLTVTPDGKNHGLMMFIDWSGSMGDKIGPTIHQLMNLTMFCRKVSIPFEVYAFSNNTSYNNKRDDFGDWERSFPTPNYQDGDMTVDQNLSLLNLISSKMTAKEYDEGMTNLYYLSIKYSYNRYAYRGRNYDHDAAVAEQWKDDLHPMPKGYNLSSTPLNEAVMAAMKMVPAFQKKYNIDKMNTVFLTDGASDGGERIVSMDPNDKDVDESDSWNARRYGKGLSFKKYTSDYNTNTLITDRLTKKTIKAGDSRRGKTDALLKILKLRTGCKVLGFYVDSKKTLSNGTLNRYFPEANYYNEDVKLYDRKKVKAEFRKNKCLVVSDNTGYDELYLLAGGDMEVTDTEMATPSENAKKGEIKRLFTSTLKSNKSSRVVLNKFITQVA